MDVLSRFGTSCRCSSGFLINPYSVFSLVGRLLECTDLAVSISLLCLPAMGTLVEPRIDLLFN